MPSPIDELYKSIYGELPEKAGTAFERFAAAASKLINRDADVAHDTRIRGEHSNSLYQIDVEVSDDDGRHAGEAKDYTERNAKVGRPDVQKLGGALPDIDVDTGRFFSATGYTKPAKQYASAAEAIAGKKIDLYDLREVVDTDMEGRVKKIVCRFHIILPSCERSSITPVWTQGGIDLLRDLLAAGKISKGARLEFQSVLSSDGSVLATIDELTLQAPEGQAGETKVSGSWPLPGGHVMVDGYPIPIHGITYEVAFDEEVRELVIEASGKATLLIRSQDGSVDKILQDIDLKRVAFDQDGNAVIKNEQNA